MAGVGVGLGDYKAQTSQAEQVRPVCQTKRGKQSLAYADKHIYLVEVTFKDNFSM